MRAPATTVAATFAPSYGQILKSTALTGGASAMNVGLTVLRTKLMAVLLGPAGIGLAGVYTSIMGVASTLAGMGISTSGVREIAEAAGTGDAARIARATCTLRRSALVLGIAGASLLAVLSYPVSLVTFGDGSHTAAIALLGLTVLFVTISTAQSALIQGLRRIVDLARANVFGALFGTVLGLPLIVWLGQSGIVPLMLVVAVAGLVCSWWFVRRIPIASVTLSWRESASEARALFALGVAFMISGLMAAAVAYLIRISIVRSLGMEAAGHYAAAYTIAGVYAGFVLQAMGADFYPRLTAAAGDNATANRLVNEQTEIALLVAAPGVVITLVFAQWVINILYAGGFDGAVPVLQWQVLGILGRIISWPMGFILLARGQRGLFLATEIAASLVHIALAWAGLRYLGLVGTGMAFAGLYVVYVLLMLVIARRETGFRWSGANVGLLAWILPVVAIVFLAGGKLGQPWDLTIGAVITAIVSWICLKELLRRAPESRLKRLRALIG